MPRLFDLRELLADPVIQACIGNISGHVEQPCGKGAPHAFIELRIFGELFDDLDHSLAKLAVGQGRTRYADYGKPGGEFVVIGQAIKRWDQLAFREVAGGAEDDDDAFRSAPLKAQRVLEGVL